MFLLSLLKKKVTLKCNKHKDSIKQHWGLEGSHVKVKEKYFSPIYGTVSPWNEISHISWKLEDLFFVAFTSGWEHFTDLTSFLTIILLLSWFIVFCIFVLYLVVALFEGTFGQPWLFLNVLQKLSWLDRSCWKSGCELKGDIECLYRTYMLVMEVYLHILTCFHG